MIVKLPAPCDSYVVTETPAQDLIHDAVRNALVKDVGTITADPFTISAPEFDLYADLAAERPIAAERAGRRIAVEIKSFLGPSLITDFERALGQYLIYRSVLSQTEPDRKIYLAVSLATYENFLSTKTMQRIVEQHDLAILVVELTREEVSQWTR